MGMAEFFGMEAGEYLERLDGIVSPSGSPNIEEFVRLARALRGSALMANQQPIAAAASGLEALARALRESKVAWDPATKQIAVRAVDDLKILVRAVGTWSPAEDAKARAIAHDLEQRAGVRASTRMAAMNVTDTGTRAFVAREGAALASALDRMARTLAQNPGAADQAQGVLKVMQPLRGLAGLADLPPLPDLLDGIQRAVGVVSQRKDAAAAAAAVFRSGARVLARAAREATTGALSAESPEVSEFVAELSRLLEIDADIVPIESLYFSDQGPHVVERGTATVGPATNTQVELVSHGDHLRQVADALDRATSDAQRALRVQPLASTLSALAAAGLAAFSQAARDALARGAAQRDPQAFASRLREAGTFLSGAARVDPRSLAQRLDEIAATIRLVGVAPPPAAPATTPPPPPRPPAAIVRPRPAAPAAVPAPPAPSPPSRPAAPAAAESRADIADEDAGGLLGSLLRFQRYAENFGGRPASLEELLAGPPVLPGGRSTDGAVVSIETLCFSGPAALARALSLRDNVRAAMAKNEGGPEVRELLEEIFDLVKLGQRDN